MDEVAAILGHYPRDLRPTRVESLGSAGGMSGAQFWRLTTSSGLLALRRWPQEHPTRNGLAEIHAILQHAASRGCTFLPVPIATTAGDTIVSHSRHFWELAPWLPGSADYEQSPRPEKLRAAMIALANFHIATSQYPVQSIQDHSRPAPSITNRLRKLIELESGGIAELSSVFDDANWPDLMPLAQRFLAAVPSVLPIAIARLSPLAHEPLRLQSCIRDIWHDHVLFTGDTVTGLIDFGAMAIDTPATDVARLLGSLAGQSQTWRDGLAAYCTIRPLAEKEIEVAAALLAAAPILAGYNWLRWILIENRRFENHDQVIDRFRRIVFEVSSRT